MISEEMDWPSKRIPQGGLFHQPKIKYSKETSDLLKLLMEESKMSMIVRKKINYHLRNGEPLPAPAPKKPPQQRYDESTWDIIRRARIAKRKTYDAIVASGAYEQQRYHPKPNIRVPTDLAKIQLQEKMSGIKSTSGQVKAKRKSAEREIISNDPMDQIDRLLDEITERADWLAEMEQLGEGKSFRALIQSQIAERLRQIEKIEKSVLNDIKATPTKSNA